MNLPKLPEGWSGPFKACGNAICGKFNGVECELFYMDGAAGLPAGNTEELVAILNYIHEHQS